MMSYHIEPAKARPRRATFLWLAPMQVASAVTAWAALTGGEILRAWSLTALVSLMSLPLLYSLEAGLLAMLIFEPLRGLLRRAQYLLVDYTPTDPIHLLTPLVTGLAFLLLLSNHRFSIFNKTPLARPVTLLTLICFLQIFNPLQGGLFVGLSGALFMLVPIAWFYFGQAVSEQFIRSALRLVVLMGLLCSLHGIYQLTYGFPKFEQYWIDNTEFYGSIAVGHVTRALATFSSAEEWGRYIEVGAIIALGFGACAVKLIRRIGWFACGGALAGALMLTGQRTAIFGFILGVIVLVLVGARTRQGVVVRCASLLLPALLITALTKAPSADDMWSKADDETVSTMISHTTRGTLQPGQEESLFERFKTWQYLATDVFPYRPLGAGIGAGSLSSLRFSDDEAMPPIDSSILVLMVACGVPAGLLFLWIIWRATLAALRAACRTPQSDDSALIKRITAALMPALLLNSFFGLTFTLYSVAPVAWLLIGWVSARYMCDPEAESLTKQPQAATAQLRRAGVAA